MLLNTVSFGQSITNIQPKTNKQTFQGVKPGLIKDTVEFSFKGNSDNLSPEANKALCKLLNQMKYAQGIETYFYNTDKIDGKPQTNLIARTRSNDLDIKTKYNNQNGTVIAADISPNKAIQDWDGKSMVLRCLFKADGSKDSSLKTINLNSLGIVGNNKQLVEALLPALAEKIN